MFVGLDYQEFIQNNTGETFKLYLNKVSTETTKQNDVQPRPSVGPGRKVWVRFSFTD